ncbi:MAG: DUF4012 domain-containing protein [Patescibacteria group bacterium]
MSKSYQRTSFTLTRLLSRAENLLLSDHILLARELDELPNILSKDLEPLNHFTGLSLLITPSIEQASNLAKEWVIAFSPLTQYKLGVTGVVSTKSFESRFTVDLNNFFISAESLYEKTQKQYIPLRLFGQVTEVLTGSKPRSLFYIDTFLDIIQELLTHKEEILSILGHYSTQKYVFFTQNIGEARANGGFMGSYFPVEVFQGRFKLGDSQSIYFASKSSNQQSFAHPVTWAYGYLYNQAYLGGLHNDNSFTCFDDSASLIEKNFIGSENGYGFNGLVMLNSSVIKKILPPTFRLDIDDNLVLGYDNILEEIERITSLEAEDTSNPKFRIGQIFAKILENFESIFRDVSLTDLGIKIITALSARDIQVWFKDKAIHSYWSGLPFASNRNCGYQTSSKDYTITPIVTNLSGDKRNLITQNQFNVSLGKNNGYLNVQVRFKQKLPPGINLQRGFQDFVPMTFVGLQVPLESTNLKVTSPESLDLKFPQPYYKEYILLDEDQELVMQDEVQTVESTARNIDNSNGFSYLQPDNTQVIGIYISDDIQESVVDFEFSIPNNKENLRFFGQPGLNEPLLSIGKGLRFANSEASYTFDDTKINSGVNIMVE